MSFKFNPNQKFSPRYRFPEIICCSLVVAQLVERSSPEIISSNPTTSKKILLQIESYKARARMNLIILSTAMRLRSFLGSFRLCKSCIYLYCTKLRLFQVRMPLGESQIEQFSPSGDGVRECGLGAMHEETGHVQMLDISSLMWG